MILLRKSSGGTMSKIEIHCGFHLFNAPTCDVANDFASMKSNVQMPQPFMIRARCTFLRRIYEEELFLSSLSLSSWP